VNYKIVILEEAKLDFKETFEWYKSIQPKLGERYKKTLLKKV
jgi:hypothetical protein